MQLNYDHKEAEWKADQEHLIAQLKVCQQALETYIIPYQRHSCKKGRGELYHKRESALTCSSTLVPSILSLDHSKPALIKNYAKFSQSPKRFRFSDIPCKDNSIAGLESTLSRLSVLDRANHSTSKGSTNEQSQAKEPLSRLVQQAKLSMLLQKNHLLFVC